jgi:hypothetical protein
MLLWEIISWWMKAPEWIKPELEVFLNCEFLYPFTFLKRNNKCPTISLVTNVQMLTDWGCG